MRVLIACEQSGIVRDAFLKRGHDAISCDILPSAKPGPHHQGYLEDYIGSGREWDMIIAYPPCIYLCNSGVRWLYNPNGSKNKERWQKLEYAIAFFNMIKNRVCTKIAIENSIPHKYAVEGIGKYTQIIQPWQFGHGETKGTCLWLQGLPKLKSTNIVDGREARIHKMPPSKDRGKLRSITYQGIADAKAEQWG